MRCEYEGGSSKVGSWHSTRTARREWGLAIVGFLVAAAIFAAFGLLCVRSALGDDFCHSEQGDFLIVYADDTYLSFYTEAGMNQHLDGWPSEAVVYAGPLASAPPDVMCLYWWPSLIPHLTTCIISGGAEG